jgi:predicted O-methyltransferase YrrM
MECSSGNRILTIQRMTTLTTSPLAPLLDRLYAEAESSSGNSIAPQGRTQAASSQQAEYLEFYGRAENAYLAVSRETGRLLYMLVRSSRAESVVEFGTSFGISTLHLAAGLRDNGGGRVISSEFLASKADRARENFAEAGLADLIDVREGDALETLARDLPDPVDLVLLDGAKSLYPTVLEIVEPHLRAGSLLVADNAGRSPEYLERVSGGDYVSVPFGGDVEISLRAG